MSDYEDTWQFIVVCAIVHQLRCRLLRTVGMVEPIVYPRLVI